MYKGLDGLQASSLVVSSSVAKRALSWATLAGKSYRRVEGHPIPMHPSDTIPSLGPTTQSIPEEVTQPGLPYAYYSAHGRLGDLVVETQSAVSQVTFSGNPPAPPRPLLR
ncbi:hypothetical protein JVT61DRAFT_12553 [Boletus reticuloceps]|uniref:Uncharacterized protein n=1 Tax=Boletus reticuloceps TaxID=495285 RepID=A0A8I2YDX7_9AGAM|nr:hypothetical protein JVT61DRAFT_12553 [Boletus reticuloceps]